MLISPQSSIKSLPPGKKNKGQNNTQHFHAFTYQNHFEL